MFLKGYHLRHFDILSFVDLFLVAYFKRISLPMCNTGMKITYHFSCKNDQTIFSFNETSQPFSHYPSKILTLKIPVDILLTWQNNPHLICMDRAARANRLLQSQLKVRATFNVSSSGKSLKLLSLNLIC